LTAEKIEAGRHGKQRHRSLGKCIAREETEKLCEVRSDISNYLFRISFSLSVCDLHSTILDVCNQFVILFYLHCPLPDLVLFPVCLDDCIVIMIAGMMLDQVHQSNTGL